MTDTITAEIGTSGEIETIELTGDPHRDIATAIEAEHSCGDSTCDIDRALEDGFPLWAASLLQGATETPLLDAMVSHYAGTEALLDFMRAADDERDDWLSSSTWTDHAHACDACGGITFGDEYYTPETCDNCGAGDLKAER